jgi:hypothetical protein
MQTVVILLLAALPYANPLLLVCAWVQRFTRQRGEALRWRTSLIWIGLATATVALLTFWMGTRYAPTSPEQNDLLFRRYLRLSTLTACTALLMAVVGQGRERKWIAASALITPLSWFWTLVIQ